MEHGPYDGTSGTCDKRGRCLQCFMISAELKDCSNKILAQTFHEATTQAYLSSDNLPRMRKIVLQTRKGTDLKDVSMQLEDAKRVASTTLDGDLFPKHHLWIEQPENIPTVLAIAPNTKPKVSMIGSTLALLDRSTTRL